ncbi:hypothetical protein [Dysosmobacter sp.]|mgnify:FL=1|uniref:hypothetical protein n=1 Tax=Dysosmobacter sp. TaxID=2591382 RepID=UPI003A952C8E
MSGHKKVEDAFLEKTEEEPPMDTGPTQYVHGKQRYCFRKYGFERNSVMKKKDFITLSTNTIGGILFALGICMGLLPEGGVLT